MSLASRQLLVSALLLQQGVITEQQVAAEIRRQHPDLDEAALGDLTSRVIAEMYIEAELARLVIQ